MYPDEISVAKESKSLNDGKYEEFIRLDDSIVDEVKRIYENALKGMGH